MIYDEIIDKLNIKSGEKIWLASDITKYVFVARRNGGSFSPDHLIDVLKECIGPQGDLIIPVFSFEFSNNGRYDYRNSKGTCGHLGNLALTREDFKRTKHPMHSFMVWGRDKELLCSMENKHSFGVDSPFGFCREENVRQIFLGTDYQRGMTYVHFVETECRVPYRFDKSFKGIYVTQDGAEEEREYLYYARRLDVGTVEQFNRIGAIMEQEGHAYRADVCGITNYSAMLGDSHDVIKEDIMHNMCRNIYDFSVDREKIFEGFGG